MAKLSILPAVHEILDLPDIRHATEGIREAYRTRLIRRVLSDFRTRLRTEPEAYRDRESVERAIAAEIIKEVRELLLPFPRRVINGTGVVIHTNLGRAPLGAALSGIDPGALSRYSNLEWDAGTQKRGNRDQHIRGLLQLLTGAETALAVNNCASALLLVLNTMARDKDVLVSRSELVEIGGGFRVPEIIESSGCRLVEVGTTNRTRLQDYEKRARRKQSVLLKVHQSNFVQRGFVESVPLSDLVRLGRRAGVPVVYDNGSGLLTDSGLDFLQSEPALDQSLKEGAGVVVSSADKLFGSIQAGLILGKSTLVEPMRRNPLYRALRLDKVRMALLDFTMKQYLGGRGQNIPLWQMSTPGYDDLRKLETKLRLPVAGGRWKEAQWTKLSGSMGGGSNPETPFDSLGLRLVHRDYSAQQLRGIFARRTVPILGYIQHGRFLLDIRTFFPDDFEEVQKAMDELGALNGSVGTAGYS